MNKIILLGGSIAAALALTFVAVVFDNSNLFQASLLNRSTPIGDQLSRFINPSFPVLGTKKLVGVNGIGTCLHNALVRNNANTYNDITNCISSLPTIGAPGLPPVTTQDVDTYDTLSACLNTNLGDGAHLYPVTPSNSQGVADPRKTAYNMPYFVAKNRNTDTLGEPFQYLDTFRPILKRSLSNITDAVYRPGGLRGSTLARTSGETTTAYNRRLKPDIDVAEGIYKDVVQQCLAAHPASTRRPQPVNTQSSAATTAPANPDRGDVSTKVQADTVAN